MNQERTDLVNSHLRRPWQSFVHTANGTEIHYLKTGQGPALILLHGANLGLIQWYPNLQELSASHTLYAIDLPGAGESSPIQSGCPDFYQEFIQPLRSFLRSEVSEPPAGMIAHSFSGWLAFQLLESFQAPRLILVNPLGFTRRVPVGHMPLTSHTAARLLAKTVMAPTEKNMRSFLESVLYEKKSDPLFVKAYCSTLSKTRHPFLFISGLIRQFKIRSELLLNKDSVKHTPAILLIHGENDFLITKNDLSLADDLLPNHQRLTFNHCGHAPSMEYASKFNQACLEFLKQAQ